MIEREFVKTKLRSFRINEFIKANTSGSGFSHSLVQRTPLGEKIVIFASRPRLVVGSGGQNIKKLTIDLKKKFKLENPQIELGDIENENLNPEIILNIITNTMERFGASRFKAVGYKAMLNVMNAGALGVEIIISGKVPSSRAKTWRFYQGYLKKCGDIALNGVKRAEGFALLKTGVVGVKVSIMPPDINLLDKVELLPDKDEVVKEEPTEKEEKQIKEEKAQPEKAQSKPTKKEPEPVKEKSVKKTNEEKTKEKKSEK